MYTFIDSIDDLAFLNEELLKKPYVGVDTEFRRTTKDNMRLALLQINDGEEIFIIDPLMIDSPTQQTSFLFDNDVTKILHSCKEDLEAIYSWTHEKMRNVFDTQLANSFLEDEYSVSYQYLVEKKLAIVLDKGETRSNWLRRPLSDSQLKYAALDVEYLINIYFEQKKELSLSNKLSWLKEDVEKLIDFTLHSQGNPEESPRTLPKAQENELLQRFNTLIEQVAVRERINVTLFFSKKAQKEFLRKVLIYGVEEAFDNETDWRKELLIEDLISLLK
ncbi:MAG: ribonuclease D [Gammaproteobacteria bacterium]